MHQVYADQGVKVFGLHQNENPNEVVDFREQTGVTFPLISDEGTLNLMSYPEGVGYPYPRDVVIDKQGKIRMIRNSFDVEEMDALIQLLLDE